MKDRAWGNLRGLPLSPPLSGLGGTLVHSRAEYKQLESVGHLALGGVRMGQVVGLRPNHLPQPMRTLPNGRTA